MKERPILFSGEMVRAILDGRKTVTRRIIKPQPVIDRSSDSWMVEHAGRGVANYLYTWPRDGAVNDVFVAEQCPYGVPGDRLYIKETWRPRWTDDLGACIEYKADGAFFKPKFPHDNDGTTRGWQFGEMCEASEEHAEPWHSPRFMRREFSRLTLEVVSVGAERLQDITEADAMAEGLGLVLSDDDTTVGARARNEFARLWEQLHGRDSWPSNPWVWRVGFKRVVSGAGAKGAE